MESVQIASTARSSDLLDPVPRHVDEALAPFSATGAGVRAQAVLGDALDLPFVDESADGALLLGPTDRAERMQVLSDEVEEEPALLGASPHLLAVGRRS